MKIQTREIGVINAMIAAGPVIIQKRDGSEKVLLVKHGDKPLQELKWKFCGGKIRTGSSFEENAIREAKEEIGIDVMLLRPLVPIILWNESPETGSKSPEAIILIHYLASISDEPAPGKEIKALQWFDLNDLPNDSAANVKPVIKGYLNS